MPALCFDLSHQWYVGDRLRMKWMKLGIYMLPTVCIQKVIEQGLAQRERLFQKQAQFQEHTFYQVRVQRTALNTPFTSVLSSGDTLSSINNTQLLFGCLLSTTKIPNITKFFFTTNFTMCRIHKDLLTRSKDCSWRSRYSFIVENQFMERLLEFNSPVHLHFRMKALVILTKNKVIMC